MLSGSCPTLSHSYTGPLFSEEGIELLTGHPRKKASWDASQQSQGSWVGCRKLTTETAQSELEQKLSEIKPKAPIFTLLGFFLTVCKSRQREIRTPTNVLGPDGSLCLWKLQFVFMETSKRFGKQTWKKKKTNNTAHPLEKDIFYGQLLLICGLGALKHP